MDLERYGNNDWHTYLFLIPGDIGGQIGLFIGAGIITYLEILDCVVMVFYSKFFEKTKASF